MAVPFRRRGRIGVIELFGMIGPVVRSSVYYQLLDRLERSPRVGAVLLDIDSPGGAVAASESLFAKVDRIRQKKPVVAFIRGSGTSGAYMVGCPATKIMALPGALVGSIGVISLRPMVANLLERLGVSVSVSKSGPLKDMGTFYRPPTDEELEKLQGLIDELFESFVERVAKARGMETERVRGFATGEVFTGQRGKEMGLVDELGDFDDALDMAAALGNVPRKTTYVRPPRGMRERAMGRFAAWAMEGLSEEGHTFLGERLWYV